jgi:hypothetical protein
VVYIGLADVSVRRRLRAHKRRKGSEWTHFSVFEVWDNIRQDEIAELEGLLRHIYRFDFHANRLNLAKGYNKLGDVRRQAAREGWMEDASSDRPPQRSRAGLKLWLRFTSGSILPRTDGARLRMGEAPYLTCLSGTVEQIRRSNPV